MSRITQTLESEGAPMTAEELIAKWRKRECKQGLESLRNVITAQSSHYAAMAEGRKQANKECADELAAILPEIRREAQFQRDKEWCEALFNEEGLGVHTNPGGGKTILDNILKAAKLEEAKLRPHEIGCSWRDLSFVPHERNCNCMRGVRLAELQGPPDSGKPITHAEDCIGNLKFGICDCGARPGPPKIGGTIGLDGDTKRCCNNPDCDNDWPCRLHPDGVPEPAKESGK